MPRNPFPAAFRVRRYARWAVALAAVLVLTSVGPAALAAGIYKWTDADGHVHYGDMPTGGHARRMHVPNGNVIQSSHPDSKRTEPSAKSSHGTQRDSSSHRVARHGTAPADCKDRVVYKTHLPEIKDMNAPWVKKAIAHCRNNRGVDCKNPGDLDKWRPPAKPKPVDLNAPWAKRAIKQCKENRGVDCENPDYIASMRPLTREERMRRSQGPTVNVDGRMVTLPGPAAHGYPHAWDKRNDKVRWMKLQGYRVAKDTGNRIVFCR